MRNILIVAVTLVVISCKSPEARKPISVKTGHFIKKSIERNRKLNADEIKIIKGIMDKFPEREFINSEHGFWFYYNVKKDTGALKMAKPGDIITYNYSVKDLNGTSIYTKDDIGTKSYAMDQQEVFSGMREGLKLLKAGETATFYFPSQMAYGYYGDEKRIGANIPLICEITINSIKDNNNFKQTNEID